jgi:hypothetical protein
VEPFGVGKGEEGRSPDAPDVIHMEIVEMSPEEFGALPEHQGY